MANWYGALRTSYVRVKDVDAFSAWLDKHPGLFLLRNDEGKVGFFAEDGDIPSSRLAPVVDEETGDVDEDWVDCDADEFYVELGAHLEDDQAMVIMQAGAEKLRYISGMSHLVTPAGLVETISLDDIYDVLRDKYPGLNATRAEY